MTPSSRDAASRTEFGSIQNKPPAQDFLENEDLDLYILLARVGKGSNQIVGLALLGLVIAAFVFLLFSRLLPVQTSTRVVFSFAGAEKGEYPNHLKFQADDLRSPAVVTEALRRQNLDSSGDFATRIRAALGVEGIIPSNVLKERDRLRVSGQSVPEYVPDEYAFTLSLRRGFGLSDDQRDRLMAEIVLVAKENFRRDYGQLPIAFGTAFETLKNADLPEYEIIFDSEISNLNTYLGAQAEKAKSFRSPSTNLSFDDLLAQTNLFAQIQLNAVLGLIHKDGLAYDRKVAMLKIGYYLRQLQYEEKHALDDENVVNELLKQAQERQQSYVMGVKSQERRSTVNNAPVLDQGLIDSLVANDAYGFLVRRALDAGLKVKRIQADESRLMDSRDNLKSFTEITSTQQLAAMEQVKTYLVALEINYDQLVANVRKTYEDYAQQEYGHVIQLSDQVHTTGVIKPLAIASLVGAIIGFASGTALSLLGFYLGETQRKGSSTLV